MSEPVIKAMVLRQPWAALGRNLDDVIADVIAKVEADIAAGELEPDPIEVHHDPVGIDGSCIRVR